MTKASSKRKSTSTKVVSICMGFLLGGCIAPHPASSEVVPIPELSTWENNMVKYGRQHCQGMVDYDAMTGDQATQFAGSKLGTTYYDGERVYYQIADYTGDPTWKYCAGLAEKFYRDQFAIPNNGGVPGYWNFTQGLLMDYLKTRDTVSKDALIRISQYAGYAQDFATLESSRSAVYARDISYAVMSYVNAEKVGEPIRARKADLINQLLDYTQQWFVRFNVPPGGEAHPVNYLKPPFVGLAMQGLIYAYEHSPDDRIPPAIALALEGLWNQTSPDRPAAWIPEKQCFWYANGDDGLGVALYLPSPDLNLLIAPAYAWMYLQTGDVKYRDRGDQIFAGGVKGAWLDGDKQFNQNYWWAFDYVKWRTAANAKYAAVPAGAQSMSTSSTLQTILPTPSMPSTTASTPNSESSTPTPTSPRTPPPAESNSFLGRLKSLMDRVR